MTDLASERQAQAADPQNSVWLAANAGSGKTRVLIDRVSRLLLGGTLPQRILCLTYTRAAASEMQNRLLARLGEWAMLPDEALRKALADLGVAHSPSRDDLARARRLFATAIETPGGLKIQTIHAFCAGLLRRFPLEAGVSPGFTELDDRTARTLRLAVAEDIADGPDRPVLDDLARHVSDESLDSLLVEVSQKADAFEAPLDRTKALRTVGLPPDFSADALMAAVLLPGDCEMLGALTGLLATSSTTDQRAGRRLSAFLQSRPSPETLPLLEAVLLSGESSTKGAFSAKIGDFPTKGLRTGPAAPLMERLEGLMARVEKARPKRLALAAAERSLALHRFARVFLPAYAARKARHGWLDFGDLIEKARSLLADRSVTQWVLYRLDGGLDHILVDEAQDTSPTQWQVVERLADEFAQDDRPPAAARTVFVVGDRKQSIYSFQGADLSTFENVRASFERRMNAAGSMMLPLQLEHSFRSSTAILNVVDLTFRHASDGEAVLRALGGPPHHIAFHPAKPGRVDLWSPVPKPEKAEEGDPLGTGHVQRSEGAATLLAQSIAREVRRLIDAGTQIETREGVRRLHEGDIMVLVQGRVGPLFFELIRAFKAVRLSVAGADRLKLAADIAVRDIAALLSFLTLPEDDLALAAVLKSPLAGWDERALFDLAATRAEGEFLWAALRRRASDFPETLELLTDLRDQADFLRPYEIIERMLTRHGGRQRLLDRLGHEAEDGIDALLAQALAYESTEVPSLSGFLARLDADSIDVTRKPDSGSRAIRVMTVHGAKGLEAPMVILPDTADRQRSEAIRDGIARVGETALWRSRSADATPAQAMADDLTATRLRDERLRLLYVAMTRAESWLVVCAAGDAGPDSWHGMIAEGIRHAGATDARAPAGIRGLLRHEQGVWPPDLGRADEAPAGPEGVMPPWLARPAAATSIATDTLSPSALGGAKALAGDMGKDEAAAMAYGSALHRLLEELPAWPESAWPEVACALADDVTAWPEFRGESPYSAARRILSDPDLHALLGGSSLPEVEVTARLPELANRIVRGTIDRLVVAPDHVLALDFKSNATVPSRPEDVPEGILRQMGAYAAILGQIYPGREVRTAILWTATGQVMWLPCDIVRAALHSTPIT